MTKEEFTQKFNAFIAKPDDLTLATELRTAVEKDYDDTVTIRTTLDTMKKSAATDAETIKTLRETNMKLFLSSNAVINSDSSQTDKNKEPENVKSVEDLLKEWDGKKGD